MNGDLETTQTRRFWWGLVLAWGPLVLFLLPTLIDDAFRRGIWSEKATGLSAVAGGLSEAFVNFGVIVILVFEVGAIALLLRTFSKRHLVRGLFSFISLGCCVLMISGIGFSLWFFLDYLPHHHP
jgi:drug/metabolite transporter (DMT)-like permease